VMIPAANCESDHARETDDARDIAVALHRRSRSTGRGQEHRAGAGARGQGFFPGRAAVLTSKAVRVR
jgi:hypothetical protein